MSNEERAEQNELRDKCLKLRLEFTRLRRDLSHEIYRFYPSAGNTTGTPNSLSQQRTSQVRAG